MTRVWQFVLGTALATGSTIALGQGPGTPPPPPANAAQHRSFEALTELRNLTQQLNLTPEQREKLRPIILDEGEQLHEVRINEQMRLEQKRAKNIEIREAFAPKILPLLTPEQQEKFKKLQEAWVGKPPEGAKEPAAPAAPPK
jgi:periplasmic protein CpxP/Spy